MLNITTIPSVKVPLTDANSQLVTTQWYRYFYNLTEITGASTGVIPTNRGGTGQTSYTNGQLLIGNSVTGSLNKNTLTAGSGVTITNGPGTITISSGGVTSLIAGVGIGVSSPTGDVIVSNTGVLSFSTGFTGLTPASNTSGAITLGGVLNVANGGTALSSYAIGDLLYATASTTLSKLPIGVNTYILASTGTAPEWVAPSAVVIGSATNLVGGLANEIAYQTAPSTTGFITAPTTAGTYLNWSGTAFQWSPISSGSAPVTKTADFTVAAGEIWIINNKSGSSCTATLPSPSTSVGRTLTFQNYQAQLLVSASSNVVPLGGGAAGVSILAANTGNWATMVSDGTNWIIMLAALGASDVEFLTTEGNDILITEDNNELIT
jgi:hypothetical protein